MKKLFLRHWHYLFIIAPLFIFICSIWDRNFYIGGDVMVPLNPANNILRIFLWDNGMESFRYTNFFGLAFYYLFSSIGIPAFIIQKILLVLLLIIGFTFTYLSYRELFKNTKYNNAELAFLAAVIFTFNPIYFLLVNAYLPLYGFPVCFYFLIKFLQKGKMFHAILFSVLLNCFFFADLPQPKILIVFGIACLCLSLLFRQISTTSVRNISIRLIVVFSLSILLNSWVLIPLIHNIFFGVGATFVRGLGHGGVGSAFGIATLWYIARFFNYCIVRYYPHLKHFLTSPVFVIWTSAQWMILVLGILFTTKDRKGRKLICTLLISTLFFIFIAKGANPPLGQFYRYALVHFPLAKIFRTTSSVVIGALMFYAFLFSVSTYYLCNLFRKKNVIVYIIIVLNIGIFYPIYFGHKFYNQANYASDQKGYAIPGQYYEMGTLLDNTEEDSKVLSIPLIGGYVKKNWPYFGPDILSEITRKPVIYRESGYGIGVVNKRIIQTILKSQKTFSLNNVGYLVFQKDTVTKDSYLYEDLDLGYPLMENDYFDLYKIPDEYFLPHIYSSDTPSVVVGDAEALGPMSYTAYLDGKPVLLFEEQIQKWRNENPTDDCQLPFTSVVLKDRNWRDWAVELSQKSEVNVGYLFSGEGGDLVNRCFDIPDDSEYIIKAKLSPNFVRAEILISGGLSLDFGLQEEFQKWSFKPSNVTYSYSVEPGILILSAYFDGDSEEDEFVQMRREGLKIDLEEYSWFDLIYKVEDPKVQTIEVVLGVDFDGDGAVDEYIKGIYPRAAATKFDKFSLNALGKVKKCFPDKEHYDLLELELYPHKLWRVDCKSFERRGKYKFCIKNLKFCNYSPKDFFKVSDYAVNSNLGEEGEFGKWRDTSNLKSYSCNIQDGNLVATARFGEKIDENVTLSRSFENLNLEKFPFIEFEYKVDDPLFQNLEVILSLDFDKDGIADKDIFSSVSLDRTFKKFKFNAFEMVRETYPDMEGYYLLQVRLRLREGRKNFIGFARRGEYSWYFRNIKIYSTSFASPNDFTFDEPVFEIDGEKYWFRKEFKDKKDTKDVLFNKKVSLKKGKHSISSLLGKRDNFEIDWIIIEPMSVDLPAENEPKIVFRKVNPTKYEVKVEGAKEPFWLVFSESFHKDWRLYCSPSLDLESFGEIVADYPELGVSEGKHGMRFTPKDIGYLFRGTDVRKHYLVNGYANGWYVEPDKLGLGENFTLILYFWPQSLFYLGVWISGITLVGCTGYLARNRRRKN